jgi:hypothetical protein
MRRKAGPVDPALRAPTQLSSLQSVCWWRSAQINTCRSGVSSNLREIDSAWMVSDNYFDKVTDATHLLGLRRWFFYDTLRLRGKYLRRD